MTSTTILKLFAYTGIVIALAPAFIPIISQVIKGASVWFSDSQEDISISSSVLNDNDIHFGETRSEFESIITKVDVENNKKNITISFPKWYLLSENSEKVSSFRKSLREFIRRALKSSKFSIQLIIRIDPASDEEERIIEILKGLDLFNCGLERRRILFCETEEGKVHITRHINPEIHIDYSSETSKQLLPYILSVYLVINDELKSNTTPLSELIDSKHSNTPEIGVSDTPPGLNIIHNLSDIVV